MGKPRGAGPGAARDGPQRDREHPQPPGPSPRRWGTQHRTRRDPACPSAGRTESQLPGSLGGVKERTELWAGGFGGKAPVPWLGEH